MDSTPPNLNQGDSLETGPSNPAEPTGVIAEAGNSLNQGDSLEQPLDATGSLVSAPVPKKSTIFSKLFAKVNIYLLLFCVVLIIGAVVFVVALAANHSAEKPTVQTQSLDQNTLKQLATSNVTVGQPKQTLNVQSNAVFSGKVLIQDSLDVAGPIKVGGSLSIPGITVSGNSVFDQVQVNKSLSVAGDSGFQGQLSVLKNISVAGGGTFGGAISAPQITANTLQLNGDLNITHHITAGGATPGRSNGSILGTGGTTSVGGSDSAGSININTGSGASAGCFITVNFIQKYNATPHVLITPVGSAAAGIGYYINRSTTNFSVCAVNTPPSNASFGFDYFVLD